MLDHSAKTILIADDDENLVQMLSARCQQLGLNIMTAHDGMTALSAVDFALPDLVCLDVNMPGGNGLGVCEIITTDERMSRVPVIIMTAMTDNETRRRCRQLNAEFVAKRSDFWDRLEPVIRQLLQLDTETTSV